MELDWSLQTSEERAAFVRQLSEIPNPSLAADYILYGRDPDGKNLAQKHFIYLSKVHTTRPEPSLDELFENPAFNESSLSPLRPPARQISNVFDRKRALLEAPPYLKNQFASLFAQIDATEAQLYAYKGKTPRPGLPTDPALLGEVQTWTPTDYTYHRKLLIELRRQQYTMRDSYTTTHILRPFSIAPPLENSTLNFGAEIAVRPLGLYRKILFQKEPDPDALSDSQLRALSKLLNAPPTAPYTIDLENEDHWRALEDHILDIEDEEMRATWNFYREKAQLTPDQELILELKTKNWENKEINKKLSRPIAVNYISTVYRKQIPHLLAEAARKHREEVENIFFRENFRVCKKCGRRFLKSGDYFGKARNSDGLKVVCKECEKEKRAQKRAQK